MNAAYPFANHDAVCPFGSYFVLKVVNYGLSVALLQTANLLVSPQTKVVGLNKAKRTKGVFEAVSLADLAFWQPETLVSGGTTQ